jgi:hypothetical protein
MRKKQRYGGLSSRHVRLIKDYLDELDNSSDLHAVLNIWIWLLLDSAPAAVEKAKAIGLGRRTVNALKAGIEVLKRKRAGRLCDWNPNQSFAAIGITLRT